MIKCAKQKTPEQQSSSMATHGRKRRHGELETSLSIDKDKLLNEARSWPQNIELNWSHLAREY